MAVIFGEKVDIGGTLLFITSAGATSTFSKTLGLFTDWLTGSPVLCNHPATQKMDTAVGFSYRHLVELWSWRIFLGVYVHILHQYFWKEFLFFTLFTSISPVFFTCHSIGGKTNGLGCKWLVHVKFFYIHSRILGIFIVGRKEHFFLLSYAERQLPVFFSSV